ncbi:MAG: CopD family protein [Sporichthyaceae bacterium]
MAGGAAAASALVMATLSLEALASTPAQGLRWAGSAASLYAYSGLVAGAGTLLFIALLWPAGAAHLRVRSTAALGAVLGLLGTICGGVIDAARTNAVALSGLDTAALAAALDTSAGRRSIAAAALWLILAVLALIAHRAGPAAVRRVWGLAVAATALALCRQSGMSSTAAMSDLAGWASFAHLAAMSIWVGGVFALALHSGRISPVDRARVLSQFSRVALACVAVVALSGAGLAIAAMDSPLELLATGYGQLLLTKLVVVGGILTLAHVNRDACTGLGASTSETSLGRVRMSIATEATLALAVLLIVSVLITTPGE